MREKFAVLEDRDMMTALDRDRHAADCFGRAIGVGHSRVTLKLMDVETKMCQKQEGMRFCQTFAACAWASVSRARSSAKCGVFYSGKAIAIQVAGVRISDARWWFGFVPPSHYESMRGQDGGRDAESKQATHAGHVEFDAAEEEHGDDTLFMFATYSDGGREEVAEAWTEAERCLSVAFWHSVRPRWTSTDISDDAIKLAACGARSQLHGTMGRLGWGWVGLGREGKEGYEALLSPPESRWAAQPGSAQIIIVMVGAGGRLAGQTFPLQRLPVCRKWLAMLQEYGTIDYTSGIRSAPR
ncbi:uncharacterized protein MYCFIDRAFT_171072 [Pseudocercospora fijiensis CIRAD86]|uniref:Uncharacterized protein n=1 Tax=Pseudocercospora fijiensis (strain CIRAD86) TaxID=383855 RepID=N1Q9X0_PSEFD|nr:uncharacterized protein MYCFIDRAFT_171072 [Pseudocercospora fijiensis CIRAD86]EME89654.1 hypothetical protein MYCFIDRAFT_171072 [Pseudocercospora fijiensis CIRAD86]